MRKTLLVYTDGGLRPDPAYAAGRGHGGTGVVIADTDRKVLFELCNHHPGGTAGTTNQRMELTAVCEALEALRDLGHTNDTTEIVIHSDSAYTINCLKNEWWVNWMIKTGWKNSSNKPVENADLWRRLLSQCRLVYHRMARIHGPGQPWNALSDPRDRAVVRTSLRDGLCVSFVKVKGHSTDVLNNRADELATIGKNRREAA